MSAASLPSHTSEHSHVTNLSQHYPEEDPYEQPACLLLDDAATEVSSTDDGMSRRGSTVSSIGDYPPVPTAGASPILSASALASSSVAASEYPREQALYDTAKPGPPATFQKAPKPAKRPPTIPKNKPSLVPTPNDGSEDLPPGPTQRQSTKPSGATSSSSVYAVVAKKNKGGSRLSATAQSQGGGVPQDRPSESEEAKFPDLNLGKLDYNQEQENAYDLASSPRDSALSLSSRSSEPAARSSSIDKSTLILLKQATKKPKKKKKVPLPTVNEAPAAPDPPSTDTGKERRASQESIGSDKQHDSASERRSSDGSNASATAGRRTSEIWQYAKTEDGKIYYVNVDTLETSWELPEGYAPSEEQEEA